MLHIALTTANEIALPKGGAFSLCARKSGTAVAECMLRQLPRHLRPSRTLHKTVRLFCKQNNVTYYSSSAFNAATYELRAVW
jgi:hypothetical protein